MSLAELRKVLKTEKVIFGANETIKNLKNGKVKRVFIANNCPEEIKKDLEYYCKISKVEIVELNQPNDEVALICKKNFPVSVISY